MQKGSWGSNLKHLTLTVPSAHAWVDRVELSRSRAEEPHLVALRLALDVAPHGHERRSEARIGRQRGKALHLGGYQR